MPIPARNIKQLTALLKITANDMPIAFYISIGLGTHSGCFRVTSTASIIFTPLLPIAAMGGRPGRMGRAMARCGFRGEWISKERPQNSLGIANIAVGIAQDLPLKPRIVLGSKVTTSYREDLFQNFAGHFSKEPI